MALDWVTNARVGDKFTSVSLVLKTLWPFSQWNCFSTVIRIHFQGVTNRTTLFQLETKTEAF